MNGYAALILADAPALYYRLNETSGITAVESVSANNGTYTPNSAGSWSGGTLGGSALVQGDSTAHAAASNGTTGYVLGPSAGPSVAPLSVECWVTVPAGAAVSKLLGRWNSTGSLFNYLFELSSSTNLLFGANSGGTVYLTTVAIAAGTHHIVGVISGAAFPTVYVDGVSAALSNSSFAGSSTGAALSIFSGLTGSSPDTLAAMPIAEVAIYSYALSAAQVVNHYNEGAGLWGVPRNVRPAPPHDQEQLAVLPALRPTFIRPRLNAPYQLQRGPMPPRLEPPEPDRAPQRIAPPPILFSNWSSTARGKHRIFTPPCYRFYRSQGTPPVDASSGGVPFATNATLPYTPAVPFSDGTWYLSVSYFDGVLDSGFLPIGPNGETYRIMQISGGQLQPTAPSKPTSPRLSLVGGPPYGVVQVGAFYAPGPDGSNAATQWAIAYTTDGSTPPSNSPSITRPMTGSAYQVLGYNLPAVADGTTLKVQLQVRRLVNATWVYSAPITPLSIVVNTSGPAAAKSLSTWPGQVPRE